MLGQKDEMAWVLRGGRELTQTDRDWLADFWEGKIKLPKKKPPHADLLIGYRTLAIEAAANEVKRRVSEALAAGDSPRDLTKNTIADVAAEYFERDWHGRCYEDFEAALNLLHRRSKAPRPSRAKKRIKKTPFYLEGCRRGTKKFRSLPFALARI
jgi:hypothetical protein